MNKTYFRWIYLLLIHIFLSHCSPVPGLKCIAGPLEQVALHHHAIGSVHVELHLGVVIRKVLKDNRRLRLIKGFKVKQETEARVSFSAVRRFHV